MKAILYNRILLVLGFLGLFIAGSLSLGHLWHVVMPCGVTSECDKVTTDPSSIWFGVYVGYIGLIGYIALTALAVLRAGVDPKLYKQLTLVGYLTAVIGTIISIGLQFQSFFVIHAMCKWCLSSAVTMTVTLIVYALLYQEASELSDDQLVALRQPADRLMSGVLAMVLALSLVGMGWVLKHSDHIPGVMLDEAKLATFDLVPKNPNVFGDANAPVKIIEFADLNCPSCKVNSPLVKEFVREHEGRVCLIYRHFPIPSHKTSSLAAAIDEYAADKGKFWDYTMAVMGQKEEIDDPNQLFQIASSINLDVNDIQKHLGNDGSNGKPMDPIYQRLTADQNAANIIGVSGTPTFIVLAPGVKPQAFGGTELRDAIKAPPYSTIIDGKAAFNPINVKSA